MPFPVDAYGQYAQQETVSAPVHEPPSVRASLVASEHDDRKHSITFFGDVLLARNVEFLMERYGPDYPYRTLDLPSITNDSFVLANFEASIPVVHEPTPPNMIDFSVHEQYVPALREFGVTHVSLANNHSFDFGQAALEHTRETLLANDIQPIGDPGSVAVSDVEYEYIGEYVVAIIPIHALEHVPSSRVITRILEQASERSDLQVAYIHWGTEYKPTSDIAQRSLAAELVAAGTDLIIGHHPHVIQEVGVIDGVPIFYSLGNFIFDQYFSTAVQTGLIVQLDLEAEPTIHVLPVTAEGTLSQPRFMDDTQHAHTLHTLAERSDQTIAGYLRTGVIPLDIPVATSPKIAMMNE